MFDFMAWLFLMLTWFNSTAAQPGCQYDLSAATFRCQPATEQPSTLRALRRADLNRKPQ